MIIAMLLLYYGVLRLEKLIFRKDSDTREVVQDSYYSSDDVFTTEDGLQFAFGITSFDGTTEPIDDPDYGHLSATYITWGLVDDYEVDKVDIPIRNCTPEELGLGEPEESKFHPIKEK